MKKHHRNSEMEAKGLHEKINCAYLDVIYGGFITRQRDSNDLPVRMECLNLLHGAPRFGCDFYENGMCEHRSSERNPELLYDSMKERFGESE